MSETTDEKPLVVGMAKAGFLLDCGRDHLYDLIHAGELESFLQGSRRKITVASIQALIAKQLAANGGEFRRSERINPRRKAA